MLVLDRNPGEQSVIIVDGEVIATVTAVRVNGGHRMKLGFDAPENVVIHRLEVYEAIKRGEAKSERLPNDGEGGDASAVRQPASEDTGDEQEGRKAG